MSTPSSIGSRRPYKLVTVSRHPEKATLMVKRLAEVMDDRYIVIHAANCESESSAASRGTPRARLMSAGVEEVRFRVRDLQPDMLCWSSSWTAEQVEAICATARLLKADVDMCGLPEESPSQKSVDTILLRLKTNAIVALKT